MATEVKLPQFGMGMQDATVVAWCHKEGDRITIDETLLEIESAKTTVEVPSPATGILTRILVPVGENVPVMAILAIISEEGEVTDVAADQWEQTDLPASQAVAAVRAQAGEASVELQATPLATRLAQEHGIALATAPASGYGGRVNATDVRSMLATSEPIVTQVAANERVQVEPRARKLANDAALPIAGVSGSGPAGRVLETDVRQALAAREAQQALRTASNKPGIPACSPASVPVSAPAQASAPPRRGMREIIASRMMQSLHGSAQLTLTSEVDVTALVRLRNYLKGEFEVSYTGLFVKACALALLRHPQVNASWTDEGVRRHVEVNIGVAVALDEGLIVPVIRAAQSKGLRQIADEFSQVVQRARSGTAGSAELTGGTFSVSNLGNWDIDAFTPVLNPPEAGILGLGRINDRLVREGDGMAWRKTIVLSLTFDHRVVDGAPAAQFLQTIARIVAQPEGLLA